MTGGRGETPLKNAPKGHAGQNIQVYVRVRPLNNDEKSARSPSVVSVLGPKEISVQEKPFSHITRTFNFDKVFGDQSAQPDVYKTVVNPLIKQVLQGYNCTVFAYGQTGTGKTFTMEGLRDYHGNWEEDPTAGIIPRSLVEIFSMRKKGGFDKDSFQIKVSFLELYNEEIFDLLSKGLDPDRKHKIFEDSAKKGSVIVQGLEERVVQSKEQVLKILEEGSAKRTTAATMMNAVSSRSHTIFTISVTITEKSIVGQEKYIEGKLNLVDLAGSENIGRSGAVNKRAREAGKINESLLTLGRVINALVKKESHIPYRESKLTRLLQDSLGGRTKTSIIATVSPASINVEETMSTLDYAHRAKNITNRPEVNQKIPVASKLAEMQARMDQIRRELEDQRERDGGVFLSLEKKTELDQKLVELEQLRKEFKDLSELFDLRSAENEKLKEDLSDTIKQLQEKTSVLIKTQEEKEVQEHLVSKHALTEKKISDQAYQLREVADQQYSDLDKLHDSKERKSELLKKNEAVSSAYRKTTVDGLGKMIGIMDGRETSQGKMCDVVRTNFDEVVAKTEVHGQKAVDGVVHADGQIKQKMTLIDSLSGDHLHSEQTFLSKTLQRSQKEMNEKSNKFQSHLTSAVAASQDQRTTLERQSQSLDDMMSSFKQHVTADEGINSAFKTFMNDILSATQKKRIECFGKADILTNKNYRDIQALKEKIEESEKKMEADHKMMLDTLKRNKENYDGLFSNLRVKLDEISAASLNSFKEHSEADEISKTASDKIVEKVDSFTTESEELKMRTLNEMNSHYEDQRSAINGVRAAVEKIADVEKTFIGKAQDEEKLQFEALEREFRIRSDEAPQHVQSIQEHTRHVQKLSSTAVNTLEAATNSHQNEVQRWRDNSLADFNDQCRVINDIDGKLRTEIEQRRIAQNSYFDEELQKDRPTGVTPARINRPYPKNIVTGTPDDERVRRYRQARDLTAAMMLKLDEGDDDSLADTPDTSDNAEGGRSSSSNSSAFDSVFESNAGESTAASSVRGGSGNNKMMARGISNLSQESEEIGYGSDMENREPSKFLAPDSKLRRMPRKIPGPKTDSKLPKASTSSSSKIATPTRSRSASRTRNALSTAN